MKKFYLYCSVWSSKWICSDRGSCLEFNYCQSRSYNMKKLLFFFLIIGLFSSSCRKDDDIIIGGPDPVVYVQTQIMGVIRDEQGQGLDGVSVRWGQQFATTDENGYYTFQGGAADEQGTIIHLSANGYFDLTKTVVPIPNGRTWMEAMMTPKTLSGSLQASAGGTVTINGGSVTLPASGLVGSGNVPYTGQVNIYATWLDPTSETTLSRMPGNLSAINMDEESGSLASFGMIGVELETPSGAPLQIAQGAEAEIRMKIPASILANAPNTIPLWHFDVVKGKWIEDGSAEKVGNEYVGKVSHFSFWNCDIFFENVTLSGRVVNPNGVPIVGVRVKATLVNGNPNISASANAWTNNNGAFGGKVPAGEILLIEILNQCDIVVFSQEVGPLAVDLDMGDIAVDLSDKAIEVTGSLADCDGNPVTNGYVKIEVGGYYLLLPIATDGSVNGAVTTCDADLLIATGYDITNLKSSQAQTYTITGKTSLDLGKIEVCDDLAEYILFSVDGIPTLAVFPTSGLQGQFLSINSGANTPDSSYLNINLNATGPGTYTPTSMEASSYDPANGGTFAVGYCQGCPDMEVTITSFGNVGELIIGSFSGMMGGNPSNPQIPVTGTFKVIRDF